MLNKKALAGTPSTPPAFVEDVFSTYLYTGTGASNAINNGIDLSGKGGLVWIKDRNSGAKGHALFDTVRGGDYKLQSQSTTNASSVSEQITSFNSNGFTLGTNGDINSSPTLFCSWTFREQAKFFDVVTYTGNGSAGRTVAHNLGSVPGMMIVKCTSTSGNWSVYHRSRGATERGILNLTNAFGANNTIWNDTEPTSTVFTVGDNSGVNADGATYVAYLFAHNAGGFGTAGTDNVISCGTYTYSGGANPEINLGFEPQWVMRKRSDSTSDWDIVDMMRGMPNNTANAQPALQANLSAAESSTSMYLLPTATGFIDANTAAATSTYIYMAIRRQMKVPTTGTEVFSPVAYTTNNTNKQVLSLGFNPDAIFTRARTLDSGFEAQGIVASRLTGKGFTRTTSTAAEVTYIDAVSGWDNQNAINNSYMAGIGTQTAMLHGFRRAPKFFDVVCYTGTGSATTFNHNLGVAPELMIVKQRDTTRDWAVYPNDNTKGLFLNTESAFVTSTTYWNDTSPTSSVFTVGSNSRTNTSSGTYVAYLFATLTGVSKVGTYTGNGSTQTINCGFSSGARFVLIKRTDDIGDWWVFDTARGINSGNDPYLLINLTSAEVTSSDFIDPNSSGFALDGSSSINTNGASYIFLAIA